MSQTINQHERAARLILRPPAGQHKSPATMYKDAAPGAPVSGLAVPVKIMPRPSPANQMLLAQTRETSSAGFTVGR